MTPQEFLQEWGISKAQLAHILNKSPSTVDHWFMEGASKREPGQEVMDRLALIHAVWQIMNILEDAVPDYIRLTHAMLRRKPPKS